MRVLFLTHRLPYAPNRGDRLRAYHVIRTLDSIARVDLVSLVHDADEAGHAAGLRDMVATVHTARVSRPHGLMRAGTGLLARRPLTHALLDAPRLSHVIADVVGQHRPDVVLAFCTGMARLALQPPLDRMPFVLDMVDVDSAKWRLLGQAQPPWSPNRWAFAREATLLERFEVEASRRAAGTTVINERERRHLEQMGGVRIRVAGNGVDLTGLRPPDEPSGRPLVVFCGMMSYEPNDRAVRWFVDAVWPTIRKAVSTAEFRIVGAQPSAALRRIAAADPTVHVTGSVAEVTPHLWDAAVSVAPIFVARGVQNKVIEAVAAGLPVVTTPQVMAGLPPEVMPACTEAHDAEAFAAAVVSLLAQDAAARRRRAASADLSALGWGERLEPLVDLLRHAANRR